MLKNHKLAKTLSTVAWLQFPIMLEYKAKWYNKQVIVVLKTFTFNYVLVLDFKTKTLKIKTYVNGTAEIPKVLKNKRDYQNKMYSTE